jgi:hypothetical protein
MPPVPPKPTVMTVKDLHAHVRRLESQLQDMRPKLVSGNDYVRSLQGENPREQWDSAVQADRKGKQEAGLRKAAQLLEESPENYPRDGSGSRALAADAGLSVEDARSVFSAHLADQDQQRFQREDVERNRLLTRARTHAPAFIKVAARKGLDNAAAALAAKAGVSISIAQDALSSVLDDDEANS